ncbi:type II secretion system F family protein [Thermosynechococcus sichuanensis E542]|uniref:Type II secretion system F family protein n=1 Tax=Thermosynechococcus sichuanensis E542 TaxID=2016101 RepID=A0A7D6J306_9CYAN|nr:type II secretion system F family protein [Thermosynechococcus vestitus]QLL29374.1 type II secretion system F family protein [Thermosynechococcus vestitus E542]
MATYEVRIRDAQGKYKTVREEAATPREARMALQLQGVQVLEVKEAKTLTLKSDIDFSFLAKITVKDKAIFARQFAALVNAGVALVRGIGVLADQCTNPKLKKILMAVNNDIQQGSTLADAMRPHPEAFDNLFIAMIQAGETGGVLDEVLNRLSKLLEDQARLNNQIKSALTYPVVVGLLAVGIFLGMVIFLIPVFEGIFKQLGGELPPFTAMMVALSEFLRTPQYMALLILCVVGLVLGIRFYYKTPNGRLTIDGLLLKLPLFGELVEKTAVARFCRTFGSLSRSGVPILRSLEIVSATAGNQVISNAIDRAAKEVQTGGMLSLALQQERVFPVLATQMINVGEETGELDKMLMKVADFYEDEVEQAVKSLTSVMEPLMIAVLGGMVGSILVAMYLPMFKIFDLVK